MVDMIFANTALPRCSPECPHLTLYTLWFPLRPTGLTPQLLLRPYLSLKWERCNRKCKAPGAADLRALWKRPSSGHRCVRATPQHELNPSTVWTGTDCVATVNNYSCWFRLGDFFTCSLDTCRLFSVFCAQWMGNVQLLHYPVLYTAIYSIVFHCYSSKY